MTRQAQAVCTTALDGGTWASHDDDGDGLCNGVDNCPYENDPTNSASACTMQAITVPWVPTDTALPHLTYSGRVITLKGIARYGGVSYKWDFGDGSTSQAWGSITNAYNLGTTHTYTGSVGQLYLATLSVASGAAGAGTVVTASYPVQINAATGNIDGGIDNPDGGLPITQTVMDTRVAVAEDEALWYLHVSQNRSTYADSTPGFKEPYGYWIIQSATCAAVDALQLHGSKPLQPYSTDPYVEDTQRGLNWITDNMSSIAIAASTTAGPSYNLSPIAGAGDSYGLTFEGNAASYPEGICALAMASSGAPGRYSLTGPAAVFGKTYSVIMQDVTDYFAWAQNDGTSSAYSGGWYYVANQTTYADGSTNQWPILGIAAAEANMGVTVPSFVRAAIPTFLNYIHDLADAHTTYYGAYGYRSATEYPNVAKTAGGILARYFLHYSNTDTDIESGYGAIYNRWSAPTSSWTDYNLGNSYAMYDVMKATQTANPKVTRIYDFDGGTSATTVGGGPGRNSFDWYYTPAGQTQRGLATDIVLRQVSATGTAVEVDGGSASYTAAGSIPDIPSQPQGASVALATAWNALILMRAVANVPPQAIICNCSAQWSVNQAITLDGSCSIEPDSSKQILNPTGYTWQVPNSAGVGGYNGTTFTQSLDVNGNGYQGPTIVLPSGFAAYSTDQYGNQLASPVYTVALQVTDNTAASAGGPQSNIATCNVIVKPPPHCPIVATGGPYNGYINADVQLDAGGSTQADGLPLTYQWDFTNTNTFDGGAAACTGDTATCSNLMAPLHKWTANGTYPIELQVTSPQLINDAGTAPGCSVVANTTVLIGNHKPTASAGGPYTTVFLAATDGGSTSSSVALTAAGSVDPDGLTLTYAWDYGSGGYTDSTSKTPTYTMPAGTAVGTAKTVCVKVSDVNGTSTPACSTITVIATAAPPTCYIAPVSVQNCSGGTVPVQLDASHSTDPNGSSFTFAWTTANCPAITNPTSSMPTISFPTASGGLAWAGAAAACSPSCTANLTLTNTYGSSTCSQIVSFVDPLTPTFSVAPVNTTIECNANTAANVNAWLNSGTAGDSCTPASRPTTIANNFTAVSGACGGVGTSGGTGGTTTVTFTGTDPCDSKTVQGTATLTVSDTQPPVLTLPGTQTVEATSAAGATVSFSATALDAATGVTAVTCAPASGSTFAIGTTTVTCSSTDVGGHKATGTFNVVVQDTTKPVLTMPSNQVLEATSSAGAVATFTATASDLVSGATAVTCTPASGATFALGTTTVSCTTKDAANNANTATFTVQVKDTTPPHVTVPSNISLEATSAAGAVATFTASSSDIVSGTTITTCAPLSGSTFAVGTTTVTCTSPDAAGNIGSSSFTVTINDTTPPVITVPSTITLEATKPAGAVATFSSTASDKVDGSADTVTCAPLSGSTFAIGTTSVTCSAKDAHNNAASASFNVVVQDTTAPSITVPSNLTLEATSSAGAVATFTSTATDIVDLTDAVTCAPLSGTTFAIGTTTVTCTSKDAHNNPASKSFTVTVQDTTGPTLTLPSPITLEATGASGATATWTASASDIVNGTTVLTCLPASGTTFAIKTTTVNCSSTDSHSNTTTGSFTVTVRDTTAPAVTVPSNKTIEATSAAGATVTFASTATDIVDGTDAVTCAPLSNSVFAIGTTTVTCSATDAHTNVGSNSFTVTVKDTTAPAVTVPGSQILEATSASGAVATYVSTATDAVSGNTAVTCTPLSGSTFAIGTATVTCTSPDSTGNLGTASFSVTVRDTTAPAITVPSNMTVEATTSSGATVAFASTATDAVDGTDLVTCLPASNTVFALGTTTVTCSAHDAHSNASSKTFTVTVQDTTGPVLSVLSNQVLEATSAAGAVATFTPTATDAVSGSTAVTCAPVSGSTFAIGLTTVSCSSTDTHTNRTAGSFTVTVRDTTAPAVTVPSNLTVEATFAGGATVSFVSTAHDAVSGNSLATCLPAAGSVFIIGTTPVTCSATDAAGNIGHNTFNVTVQDTTGPVVSAPPNQTYEATGPGGANVTDYQISAVDAVAGATSISCSPSVPNLFAIGENPVECRSSDAFGNATVLDFRINVVDTTAPAVTVPAPINLEAVGPAGATVVFASTASDIVDITDAVTCSPVSGSAFAVGTTTVTCGATDAHGNHGSSSFNVVIKDTTAPVLTLPANISAPANEAEGTVVNFVATAADVVDVTDPVVCSPASGATFPIGVTTVSCSATDKHANVASGSFTVTVTDKPNCTGVAIAYLPAIDTFGTMMYEDNYPNDGDLDFNDQVVAYNYVLTIDSSNRVVQIQANYNMLAAGATLHNGLYLHFAGVAAAAASSITMTSGGVTSQLTAVSGESQLVVQLLADTRTAFPGMLSDGFINTQSGDSAQASPGFELVIKFTPGQGPAIDDAPFDLYIARPSNFTAGKEIQIHKPIFAGTDKVDSALFNHYSDNSSNGLHFINETGLPFAMEVPQPLAWMGEKIDLAIGYPGVIGFAGGDSHSNWYQVPTNTNASAIYHGGANNSLPPTPGLLDTPIQSCFAGSTDPHNRNHASSTPAIAPAKPVKADGKVDPRLGSLDALQSSTKLAGL